MRIGIDFDNTIVSYDAVFHKVVNEYARLPDYIPMNKVAIRDYLRRVGREELWTELQGQVYGSRMQEASIFDGVLDFFRRARSVGHELFIISHRTRHPFMGMQYDLHEAAQSWIERHLICNGEQLLRRESIFFELTKSEKIARIAACECEAFIDDLPEILTAKNFPAETARFLFDPKRHYNDVAGTGLQSFNDWQSLDAHFNYCEACD